MRIFQAKYLIVSLVIHSTVIGSFLLFQKSAEKAETFMVVTEIIKIEESNKSSIVKKIENPKKRVTTKENSTTQKPKLEIANTKTILKPQTSSVVLKPKKLEPEKKTDDIKRAQKKDKSIKSTKIYHKNSSDKKIGNFKNLSKANYKIGSITNPHPPYPFIARKKGIQGKLILEVFVNEDGSVKNVRISQSSGYEILDKVSKMTIEKWIFIPAKKSGQAVKDNILVPIRFILTE